MIFTLEEAAQELSKWRNTWQVSPIVAASGGFDPLHISHVKYLQAAQELTFEEENKVGAVVVIVNGDGFLTRKKGKPFMKLNERMGIINALKYVDIVVPWESDDQTVCGAIEALKPDIFAKGGDRNSAENIPEFDICQKIGCQVRFGVGGFDKVQSSSNLLKQWTEK